MIIPVIIGITTLIILMRRRAKAFIPSNNIDRLIKANSEVYGIDPFLIKALIKTESDFNTKAISAVGARGLMQLMINTARIYDPYIMPDQLYDPEKNISIGSKFLKDLIDRYGNVQDALAHYNLGKVDKWTEAGKTRIINKYAELLKRDPNNKSYQYYYNQAYNAKVGDYVNYAYVNKIIGYYNTYMA